MANRKSIFYQVNFQSNDKELRKTMNNLVSTLDKISNIEIGVDDGSIQDAVHSAQTLEGALAKAMNKDTGKLDLTKFNQSLLSSGQNFTELTDKLRQLGPQGQQAFSQMAQAIAQADAPIRKTSKLVDNLWVSMKNTAQWKIASGTLDTLTNGLKDAVNYARRLDSSLNDIRIVTGQSAKQMEDFANRANKAAKQLSTSTLDYSKASLIYYQQGLGDKEVKERTDATIKMANVTGESAEQISQYMTAVWNNFDNGTKTLEYYADAMAALGAATASSTDEIATGLEKFAGIAETVGLSYEYATSALATLTAETRQSPETVGTALKTIFSRLQGLQLGETLDDGTTLNKYSEALATIGVDIKAQGDKLKDMDQILDEIGAKWQGLAKDQKMALAQTVGGVRQYTQLITLMDNYNDFQTNVSTAKNSQGTLDEQQFLYAQGWEAANERVKASMEGLYQEILDDDFFKDILNFAADFVDGFTKAIDAVGGIAPILALISSLIISKLGPNISQMFNDSIKNINILIGREADQVHAIQQTTEKLLEEQNMMKGITTTTQQQNDAVRNQLTLKNQLYESSKYLSAEQKKEVEEEIQQLEKLSNLITDYTGDLQAATQLSRTSERDVRSILASSDAKVGLQGQNEIINNFNNINSQTHAMNQLNNRMINGSIAPEQMTGLDDATKLDSFYNKLEGFNQQAVTSFSGATQSFGEFKKQIQNATLSPELEERIKSLDDRFLELSPKMSETTANMRANKNDAKGLSSVYEELRNNTSEADLIMEEFTTVFKEVQVEMYGTEGTTDRLRMALDGMEQGFHDSQVAVQNLDKAIEMSNKKTEEMRQKIAQWSNGMSASLQKISTVASSALSVFMAFSSIKTIFDENATASEKWVAALMAITTLIGPARQLLNLLAKIKTAKNVTKQAGGAIAESQEAKQEKETQIIIRGELQKTEKAVQDVNNKKLQGLSLLEKEEQEVKQLTIEYQKLHAAKQGKLPMPSTSLVPTQPGKIVKQPITDPSRMLPAPQNDLVPDIDDPNYWDRTRIGYRKIAHRGRKGGKWKVSKKIRGTTSNVKALESKNLSPIYADFTDADDIPPVNNAPKALPPGQQTPTVAKKDIPKGASKAGSYLGVAVAGAVAGYAASQTLINTFGNQRDYAKEYDEAIATHAEAQANVQKWQGELEKAYENLDKLKTYLSEVETANVFEGLTQGTAAWDKKLIEANNATKDLLKSYGMLSSKNYTKDANGLITLTAEAKKEIEEKSKQEQQTAQENLLVAENAEIAAKSNKQMAASKNLIAGMNEGVNWGTIGAGAASGAAAGAIAGVILPGVGNIVGAAIGGIAGLITGSIGAIKAANESSDTKLGEEYEDLANTLAKTGQTYEEYVNDGGTISEGLKNLLGDANLAFDELTVEQQKLRKALENNTMALEEAYLAAESTAEEQAYNNLVAQGYDKEIADKAAKIGVNRMTLDVAAEKKKLEEEDWGTEGISKATKTNKEAKLRAEEYIKAAGLQGAELVDTTGTDKNRRFVFKLEDGSTLEKTVEHMMDVVAQYNASEAAQKKAEAVAGIVQKASNMTGTDGEVAQGIVEYLSADKTTDGMTIDQIMKTQEALNNGTIEQIITDLGVEDWTALNYGSQEDAIEELNERMQLSDGFWDNLDQGLVDTSELSEGAVDNLNEAVQQLSSGPIANGGDILKNFLNEALTGLDPQEYSSAINDIFDGSINFEDFDAPGQLAAKFDDLGLAMDIDSSKWIDFMNQMREASNNIPDFSDLINQLTNLQKVLNELEFGDTVDKEVYEEAINSDASLQEYFLNVGDDKYKFYGNPDELTNAINKGFENYLERAEAADEAAKEFQTKGIVAEDSTKHQITGADNQTGGVYDQGVLNNPSNYSNEDWFNEFKNMLANPDTQTTAGQVLATAGYNDPNQVLAQASVNNDDFINKLRGAISDALRVDHGEAAYGGFIDSSQNAANIVKTLPAEAFQNPAAQNAVLEKAKEFPEIYEEILKYIDLINQGHLKEANTLGDNIGKLQAQQNLEQEINNLRQSAEKAYETVTSSDATAVDKEKAYTDLANTINTSGLLPENLKLSGAEIQENWGLINKLLNDTNLSANELYSTMTKLQNTKISDALEGMTNKDDVVEYLKTMGIEFDNTFETAEQAKKAFADFAAVTSQGLDMASDTPLQSYQEKLAAILGEAGAAKYMLEHFGDKIDKDLYTTWHLKIDIEEGAPVEKEKYKIDNDGNIILTKDYADELGLELADDKKTTFTAATSAQTTESNPNPVNKEDIPENIQKELESNSTATDNNVKYQKSYIVSYVSEFGRTLSPDEVYTENGTMFQKEATNLGYHPMVVNEVKTPRYLKSNITHVPETKEVIGYKFSKEEVETAVKNKKYDETEFKNTYNLNVNVNGLNDLNGDKWSSEVSFGASSQELIKAATEYEEIGKDIELLDAEINNALTSEDIISGLQKRVNLREQELTLLKEYIKVQEDEITNNKNLLWDSESNNWANTFLGYVEDKKINLATALQDSGLQEWFSSKGFDPFADGELTKEEIEWFKTLKTEHDNETIEARKNLAEGDTTFEVRDLIFNSLDSLFNAIGNSQDIISEEEKEIYAIEKNILNDSLNAIEKTFAKRKQELEFSEKQVQNEINWLNEKLTAGTNLESAGTEFLTQQVILYDNAITKVKDLREEYYELIVAGASEEAIWAKKNELIAAQGAQAKALQEVYKSITTILKAHNDEIDRSKDKMEAIIGISDNYISILETLGERFDIGTSQLDAITDMQKASLDMSIKNVAVIKEQRDAQKAVVDGIDKSLASMEKGSNEYNQLMQIRNEEASKLINLEKELASTLADGVEQALEKYESSIDTIIKKMEDAMAGDIFKSLDETQEAYDRATTSAENYLSVTTQEYELSKLRRSINSQLQANTTMAASIRLRDILEDINKIEQDGLKMSEYDLKMLNAKYELYKAQIALEDAQNNKSQVRLQRNASGNWSYVFTADQGKIDEAAQKVEDAQYNIYKESEEHLKETEENILELQRDWTESLREIYEDSSLTEEQRIFRINQTNTYFASQIQAASTEIQKVLDITGIKFEDTALSAATGFTNLKDVYQTTADAVVENTTGMETAIDNFENATGTALKNAGLKLETFGTTVQDLADPTKENSIPKQFNSIAKSISDSCKLITDSITPILNQLQSLQNLDLGTIDYDPNKDYAAAIGEYKEEYEKAEDETTKQSILKKAFAANELRNKKIKGENRTEEQVTSEEIKQWFLGKTEDPFAFATGGYTGNWNDSGKLGILHQKELVLNQKDTKNILSAVEIVRTIAGTSLSQMHNLANAFGISKPNVNPQALQQEVHIEATFPGVQSAFEIETALKNIVNDASQYAEIPLN